MRNYTKRRLCGMARIVLGLIPAVLLAGCGRTAPDSMAISGSMIAGGSRKRGSGSCCSARGRAGKADVHADGSEYASASGATEDCQWKIAMGIADGIDE